MALPENIQDREFQKFFEDSGGNVSIRNSSSVPTELELATGSRTGYFIVNKFGENSDVDTASLPEDIWTAGGVYTGFPVSDSETVDVSSASANDDEGGSGAEKVLIIGLDANWALQQETITLNGTSNVTSTGTYRRVNRAYVTQSANGANTAFNAGDITIQHTTTTSNIFAVIPAGTSQTRSSGYTIPANSTGYVRSMFCEIEGSSSAVLEGVIWARNFGAAPRLIHHFTVKEDRTFYKFIYGGIEMTEKTDFIIRIIAANANNVDVTAEIDIVVVPNS